MPETACLLLHVGCCKISWYIWSSS